MSTDLRPVRAAYEQALGETRHAPPGPDGCTHGDTLKWYVWTAQDPTRSGGQCFCIGCMLCGTVLAGARQREEE